MHNIDMDSIVEYAIEKVKTEIKAIKGSKIVDVDIDDVAWGEKSYRFDVIGYNKAGRPISYDTFMGKVDFEDAPGESEEDAKWLVDNAVGEFAYNFVKHPNPPSDEMMRMYDLHMREEIMNEEYNIQFYQIFSNPEKPTDNGKMIAQAGTEDEAKAKGNELVGKGNYLIKAVCDDGKVRDVDLHDYFNESKDLKEYYRGEDALDDVLSWLQDHKQAWNDFTAHFSDVEDEDLTYDMVIDWISEHETLYNDYLSFFGDDEELDESRSMTADEPGIEEIQSRVQDYLDNHPYSTNMDIEDICEEVADNLFDLDYHKMSGDASYEIFNIVSRYVDNLDEAIEMTADEMKAKHGTDNSDIINAGKPEEERVALKEDSKDKIIANNIEEFCNMLGIEYKRQWGAGLFYPTSWNVYREFEDMLRSAGLGNLPFYYYHPKHDKGDPDAIICVEDDGDENIEYVQVTANSEPIYASGYTPQRRDGSLTEGANAYNVTFYMDSLDDNVMSGPSTTKKIYAASKEEAEKKLRAECTDKYYIPTITDVELVESIVTEELKPGDRVYVTVSNRQGNVIKMVSDDVVEVELDGGLYPARIDRFYVDEVKVLDMQPEVDDEIDYDDVDPDAVVDSLKAESMEEPELLMDEDLGHTIGTALFCTASIEVCTIGGVDEDGEDVDEPVIFDDKTPVNTILAAIDPDTDAGDAKCAEINQLLNAMPDGYIQVQAYCRGRDMGDRQVYDAYELYDEIRDIFNLDESLTESNNAYTYRGHYIINDGSTWMIKDGNNQVIRSGIATDSEAEEIIDDLDESVDYNDKFIPDDDM